MNTTYEELVELIKNKQLVKDTSYTFQYSYADNGLNTSGNHPFYLTVKAIGNDSLYISAVASKISGTQYFNNSDLSKWIIYYTVNKYDWVGSGSTGTIYYLKDEWDNVAQFDFKNIKVNGEYLLQDINGDDMSVSQLSLCRDNRLTGANASTLTALNNIHLKQLEANNEVKYNNIDSTNQNIIISGEFNTIYSDCSNITLIGDHNTVKNINNQIDINGNGNTIDSNNDTITIVGDDNNIKDSNNVDIVGSGNSTDSSTDTVINGDNNIVNGSTNTDVTGNDNYVNDSNDTVINGGSNDVDNSNNTNLGGDNNTIGDSDGTTITNGDNNIINGSTNTTITDSNNTTITDSDGVNGTIPDGGSVDDGILTDPSTGDKTDVTDPDNPVISDEPVKDAPADDIIYGRQNEEWVPVPIQEDAPADGNAYVRENNGWSKANLGATKWGEIEGNIANQTDLQAALDAKQSNLTAGKNISIVDNTVNALGYVLNQSTRGVSVGSSNSTSGTDSFAYGTNCSASGNHSIAGGDNSQAQANDSVALGRGCVAKNVGQAVFGRYNEDAENSLFVVGKGTSSGRSNALEVYEYLLKVSGRINTYGIIPRSQGPVQYTTTGWKRILTINNQTSGMFCIMRSYRFYRPELYLFTFTAGYPNSDKAFKIQQISGGWEDDSAQFIDQVRIGRVGTTTTTCIDIHIAREPMDGLASKAENFYVFPFLLSGSVVFSNNEPEAPTIYKTIDTRNMLCDYIATASTSGSTAPYNLQTITNSNFTNLTTKDNNTLYFIV